jgi:4-hydroxythreonine-4-phosphate dehydrogenase
VTAVNKPVIGIPMGDAAGIGPEIVVKTFADENTRALCRMVLIGDAKVIKKAVEITKTNLTVNLVASPTQATFAPGSIDCIDLKNIDAKAFRFGRVDAMCGKAAYDCIEKAAKLAMAGEIDAIATPPINKESLKAAGVPFIGHTEILAYIANVRDPLTMFEVRGLRVFFLSRHVSLRKACDMVTYDRVLDCIERSVKALARLGVSGTMAVAGLNPHSGEHGLFGDEEMKAVTPAVEEAKRRGLDVTGPVGADSVFHLALQGRFASVLSLYHDQGHIATKTLDFERTVSITNSMPFLRTSVDHGTAFDIAGKNIASAVSMIEAVRVAAKYALHFRQNP